MHAGLNLPTVQREEITTLFDKQASSYDEQWSKLAPISAALHLLSGAVLSNLRPDARILCVGAGTGNEIIYLAEKFPHWHFTAVEPSAPMLDVFQHRAEQAGITSRCTCHVGYLDSLPESEPFDAATSILVSHFILDQETRIGFFKGIAERLAPQGILITADLSGDLDQPEGQNLLETWFSLMALNGTPPEGIQNMRIAYRRDVGILPTSKMADILTQAGFPSPIQFLQTGMIHAWHASKEGRHSCRLNSEE